MRLALSPICCVLIFREIFAPNFKMPFNIVLDSAIKISPLLPAYIHLGWLRLSANFVTVKPSGAIGLLPSHPITLLKFFADLVA